MSVRRERLAPFLSLHLTTEAEGNCIDALGKTFPLGWGAISILSISKAYIRPLIHRSLLIA